MDKRMFQEIKDKFKNDDIIDFQEVIYDNVNFVDLSKRDINKINKWVKDNSCIYEMKNVILYHGTSESHNIENEGIKRTTKKMKKSAQSATGFVYLSLYPDSAKTFGELAYPNEKIKIYAVNMYVKDILPDHDQLKNKRLWGSKECEKNIGKTIGDSLVYGNGCRVKRDVHNYQVRDVTDILNMDISLKNNLDSIQSKKSNTIKIKKGL